MEQICNSDYSKIKILKQANSYMKKKRAKAVAVTHFTASDMMELNAVMVESFGDLTHFIDSIYKMLSLTMFPHSKIPSPQNAHHAQPLQCSRR